VNISSRQFGAQNLPGVQNKSTMPPAPTLQKSLNPGPSIGTLGTRPVPMPSTIGSFGSGSSGMRPAPMVTPKLGGSMGSPTKPVKMPTKMFGR
jgi:hypothetical protein